MGEEVKWIIGLVVTIVIGIAGMIVSFFGGRAYQRKIVQKYTEKKKNIVHGFGNVTGDGNEVISGDKTTTTETGNKVEGNNNTTVIASGNGVAAGRDINYDGKPQQRQRQQQQNSRKR